MNNLLSETFDPLGSAFEWVPMSQRRSMAWQRGDPPHPGWWCASARVVHNPGAWRYWNGQGWSQRIECDDTTPRPTTIERNRAVQADEAAAIDWLPVQPLWGQS